MFLEIRKTIFCDIDGTIFAHRDSLHEMISASPVVLPGVIAKFTEWREKDYHIVLTTARPEGCRDVTVRQLESVGLFYDQLVMGLPTGQRIVINDTKPSMSNTAKAIVVERNKGLRGIDT